MTLSKEFTAGISEAADTAVAEAGASADGATDQNDAGDAGEESDAKEQEDASEAEGNSDEVKFEEIKLEESELGESSDESGESDASDGDDGVGSGDAEKVPAPTLRTPELVERAVRVGMSMRNAMDFPSDVSLENTCTLLEQSQAALNAGDQEEQPDQIEELLGKLESVEYDEEAAETIGTLVGAIRQQQEQIKELQEGHEQSVRTGTAAAAREVEQWFDGEVEALGPDFKESLGEGAYSSLAPGSPQLAKREAIADQVAILGAGLQATGKTIPPREELFKQAAGLVLRDEMQKIHERKLEGSLRSRSKQHISRAGRHEQSQSTESPVDATVAALRRKFPNA